MEERIPPFVTDATAIALMNAGMDEMRQIVQYAPTAAAGNWAFKREYDDEIRNERFALWESSLFAAGVSAPKCHGS